MCVDRPIATDGPTSDLTAVAGRDYLARSGVLAFASGQQTNSFTVPILNNFVVDGTRLVLLTLTNTNSGTSPPQPTTATLAIVDDERSAAMDPTFVPALTADSSVDAMVVQADGKIVLGGDLATSALAKAPDGRYPCTCSARPRPAPSRSTGRARAGPSAASNGGGRARCLFLPQPSP